jgi:hypothetical protein
MTQLQGLHLSRSEVDGLYDIERDGPKYRYQLEESSV